MDVQEIYPITPEPILSIDVPYDQRFAGNLYGVNNMRKSAIALAAFAAVGIALPLISSARAEDEKVLIKRSDRDHDRDRDWRRHHAEKKVVIIKHRRHRDHDND